MTKGQEWMDEWNNDKSIVSLPDFIDRKIEELRDEYQAKVSKAWTDGYEYCEKLDKWRK
jgi:hypothetical protein